VVEVIRRLSLLTEAARAMTSLMDPDALLDRILDMTREVFGFDACALLLLDEGAQVLEIHRARGYDAQVVRSFRARAGEGVTGRALQSREPVVVHDVGHTNGYVAGVPGAVAEVAVPLCLDSRVLGVLDAESTRPLELSSEDLSLLTSFASHAATVVNNARLHADLAARTAALDRKLEQQRLIVQASEVMLASLSCDEVLTEILSLAKRALRFETCAVLLLEDDQEHLQLHAAHGYRDDWRELRIAVGQGVTGRAVRTGAPVLVSDVTEDPDYIPGVSGGRCELAVPLRVRDRTLGVLDVEATAPGAFRPEDVDTLSLFAHFAAVSLRNAAQVERIEAHKRTLEQQLKRQALVQRAGEAVRSTLREEELLRQILGLAREALEFSTCAALLLDPQGETLRMRAAVGYGRDVSQVVVPAGEGITGRALAQGEPVLVTDVRQDPAYIEGMTGGRCEMVVPLQVAGEIIGVLDAEADAVGAFDTEDLALFQIFASDVAVAVRNARQFTELERANRTLEEHVAEIERMNAELSDYADRISQTNEDLEKRVRELGTIYQASQTITASLDLDQTLQSIVEMTKTIINASSSAIRLLDEESDDLRSRSAASPTQAPGALAGAAAAGGPRTATPGDDGGATAAGVAPSGAVRESPPPPAAPDASEAAEAAEAAGSGNQLQTPLRIGNRTIGVFELGRDRGVFSEEEKRMLQTLASQAAIAIENSRLFERTQRTYYETIRALAEALEARDAYTRGHSERVTNYALAIADALALAEEERRIIEHAGLLHDIGKIGISDSILHKTSQLSAADRKIIESHPLFGDTILGPIKFLHRVQAIVKHHHERYDGTGYPDGLTGEQIPLSARIVCVADSYDAMTSDRPYRRALTRDEAVAELLRNKRRQFDPHVVDVFVDLLETRFPEARGES
jgi:putative nucleotidyltransferase with HDIG domain